MLPSRLMNARLVKPVLRRVVSEEVLAENEITGGGGRGRLDVTLHCQQQGDSTLGWAGVKAILMFH